MAARIFLPARRGEHILVFEHREQRERRRWEFVAAAVKTPDAPIRPTGVVMLKPPELKLCGEMAERLPALESYLTGITPVDLGAVPTALDMPTELALIEGSSLFTMTLYLQLQRNALVVEASLSRYTARALEERFEPGLSASVVNSLLKMHDLGRAAALLDEDLVQAEALDGKGRDWAYFYAQAAMARERHGQADAALDMAERAHRANPTNEALRRIGNLKSKMGDRAGAIEAFLDAEKLGPLPVPALMRLGRWLVSEERVDEARHIAGLATSRGADNADIIFQQDPKAG
ncbi:MAG: tetratricopeptide repeat protein [Pseudomonadota bacterium]